MHLLIFLTLCISLSTQRLLEPRVINGDVAAKAQFPWQVALYIVKTDGSTWCGGALISDRWVLTAGHCVQDASHFTVAMGSNGLVGKDSNRVVVETIQFVQHEDYNPLTLDNDVAVLFLPRPVSFNDHIQPITLLGTGLQSGTTVIVSGWGLTSDGDTGPSPILNYGRLVTIPTRDCSDIYGSSLPSGVLCARSNTNPIQSTCEGDSGGPLVTYISNKPVHVGIVSFGHSDGCESGYPVAFAKTEFYRDWIRENTGV